MLYVDDLALSLVAVAAVLFVAASIGGFRRLLGRRCLGDGWLDALGFASRVERVAAT